MNDPNKHGKTLDRPAFLKAYREKPQNTWDADSFEGKALKGLQHLRADTDLGGLLGELDQRIDRASNPKKKQKGKVVAMRYRLAAAAGILLLVCAAFFFFQQPGPQQLASRYFEPFPNALSEQTRGSETTENNLSNALRLYENGAYDAALPYFQAFQQQQPGILEPLLYQGISKLAVGEYRQALDNLSQVAQAAQLQNEYRDAAQWYQALAYLGLEQTEQARMLLLDLAGRQNFFQEKAKELVALI